MVMSVHAFFYHSYLVIIHIRVIRMPNFVTLDSKFFRRRSRKDQTVETLSLKSEKRHGHWQVWCREYYLWRRSEYSYHPANAVSFFCPSYVSIKIAITMNYSFWLSTISNIRIVRCCINLLLGKEIFDIHPALYAANASSTAGHVLAIAFDRPIA